MRLDNYDLFCSEYADFLVYELIPYIKEKYNLRISPDPDWHMTSGGSSGGISAFMIAWFHPEYFHRVYMSSPSFLAMGRGNEIPVLIRKYETKPLKVYEEYSEDEPNEYFGASFWIDQEAKSALEFAGYDSRCVFFPGESHCSRLGSREESRKRLSWLWDGYMTTPVRAPRNSPRVSAVIPDGSVWETADHFPAKDGVTLNVLSADHTMRYFGGETEDVLFKVPTDKPEARHCHGFLHTLPLINPKGAIDLAVDEGDRLFVLTSIGIQCVRSFGLIDTILDLPDRSRPLGISFGDPDRNWLYVRTEQNVYKRLMRVPAAGPDPTVAKTTSYYD